MTHLDTCKVILSTSNSFGSSCTKNAKQTMISLIELCGWNYRK